MFRCRLNSSVSYNTCDHLHVHINHIVRHNNIIFERSTIHKTYTYYKHDASVRSNRLLLFILTIGGVINMYVAAFLPYVFMYNNLMLLHKTFILFMYSFIRKRV